MDNKKLAIILIIISLFTGFFLIYFNSKLSQESNELNCMPSEECNNISQIISITNIAFGFFGFMLALGFYILFFNKSEQLIINHIKENKEKEILNQKFEIILSALNEDEKKVIKVIKEQDGITQNVLRLKANLSKSKLSYVLQELEKRNLIKRTKKGKTLQVFLRI